MLLLLVMITTVHIINNCQGAIAAFLFSFPLPGEYNVDIMVVLVMGTLPPPKKALAISNGLIENVLPNPASKSG